MAMGLTRVPFSEVTNVVMLCCACFWLLAIGLVGLNPAPVVLGAFGYGDGQTPTDITPLKKSFGPAAAHYYAGVCLVFLLWSLGFLICSLSGHDAQSGFRVSHSCLSFYMTYVAFVGSMVKAPGYRFPKSTWAFTLIPLVALWLEVFQEGTSVTADTLAEELIAILAFAIWFLILAARHPKDMWGEEGNFLDDTEDE
jgi:hypothetical protein